jgi:hypothetical protein
METLTSGLQPITTTTDLTGNYTFSGLAPGIYGVVETQPSGYGSVSDSDGGNPNQIRPIVVNTNSTTPGNDFVEIKLGSISGSVFVGAAPLPGVILTLLDGAGNPVDGDPTTTGVQPITAITNSFGVYTFTGVKPGTYQVAETQPAGYNSTSDTDGGNINIIGDVTPITILPGQNSVNNNFVEVLDTCPDTWAEWQSLYPGQLPPGNLDGDAYDNFAEFAFAMPANNGTGNSVLGSTAWVIRPSTVTPGTLDGVFVRPKGAPLNVTYTLQYALNVGTPTVWQSLVITPSMITTVDNGDCTETVTLPNLELLTGLVNGTGVVRIKAELDEVPGSGIDHTTTTEVEGWKETPLELCCRTHNDPYLREAAFTGTVDTVTGQNITFSLSGGSANLSSVVSGGAFYLEVTSGDQEGQRFDITSASGNTVTLANDSALHGATAPYNTLTGAPPASLSGDKVVIRRHWTLGDVFPPTGFGSTTDPATADQVKLYIGGAWVIYWLYNDSGTPRWVKTGDNTFGNQNSVILAPGQGLYFNNNTVATSVWLSGRSVNCSYEWQSDDDYQRLLRITRSCHRRYHSSLEGRHDCWSQWL